MSTLVQGRNAAEATGRFTMASLTAFLLRYNFIVIFFVVAAIATCLSNDFLTWRNICNLFQQSSVVGIVAIGMTFVILTANIDLSVGSMVACSGLIVSLLMQAGIPPAVAIPATFLIGTCIGATLGAISAYAAVPSFIVTLAGLVTIRGVTFLLSNGAPIGGLPHGFGAFGSYQIPLLPGVTFPILGLLFLVVWGAASLVLRYTVFGEYVFATGGNAEAARLSGLPVRLIVTLVFAISGLLSSLSGVLLTARLRIGQPTAAQGLELDAIAAVVLGGTSLFGGRGSVLGTLFAVMLLQVLRNIFNLLGLGSFYQMTITGLIIIAAILLNRVIDSRQGRR
ncbi:ribose ABC transporter permease [Acetobacteraceae bacterium KSS8]|uniref:Ribose ABC transporter permease n=1 Tax=Endosaccharibacter trunci TaxID=2812733 RepID=A0ABT1W7F8_9PROT|nr:ribose ABC transporter permease [Acetobacteraceae bacterium KSS8]